MRKIRPPSISGYQFIVTETQDYIQENNGHRTEINANGALITKKGNRVPIFI